MFKYENGEELKCKVTGFTGIATARIEYINGCIQYCIKPECKDNVMPESEYIDEQQLQATGKRIHIYSLPTGGPQADCPRN